MDYTFISALGKAFSWQRMLDEGKYETPKELAQQEQVEVTYMYRVMRRTLLAPDIIEAILNGTQPRTLTLQNVVRGLWRCAHDRKDRYRMHFYKPQTPHIVGYTGLF